MSIEACSNQLPRWRRRYSHAERIASMEQQFESIQVLPPTHSPLNNANTTPRLMTHLYQYFGIILGCDEPSFPKYAGNPSQAAVHRFMDLKAPEMHYFIHNIYDAALTLGVAGPDLVTHVGDAISIGVGLDNIFNKKCSPPQKVATYQPSAPQSMCHDNAYVLILAPPSSPKVPCKFPR